jgi:type I restriction enzyme S subunit
VSEELPPGWVRAPIGALCQLINGRAFKPTDWKPEGLPIIRIQNLNNEDAPFNRYPGPVEERHLVSDGELLFAWSGTPGTSFGAHVWTRGRAVLNQHIFRVLYRADVVDRDFFRMAINFVLDELIAKPHGGAGLAHITKGRFEETEVLVPPLAEQRRIVARIEALFARIRQARADLLRIAPLSERYHLAVLRSALRGELTADWRSTAEALEPAARLVARTPTPMQPRGGREATDEVIPGVAALSVNNPQTEPPPGWMWVPLLRLARQESGHTPSRGVAAYWNGDIPWIGIRDAAAHHGGVINDTAQHVTQAGLDNSSARLLPAQTVCLSRTASVGYVVVMGRPMATSQDFVTWTCSPALLPDFLKYALLAEGDDIRRFGKGSTHTTIYFPEIRALHICLPPLAEQREIVRILDEALPAIRTARHEATRALALLDHLERSILTRAFRGELVPQDPADEPASVSLARSQEGAPAAPRRGRPRRAA